MTIPSEKIGFTIAATDTKREPGFSMTCVAVNLRVDTAEA
jgi:hypothetical protein